MPLEHKEVCGQSTLDQFHLNLSSESFPLLVHPDLDVEWHATVLPPLEIQVV
jgi:hypothetical protein